MSDPLRGYIVIIFGVVIGASPLISTVRLIRQVPAADLINRPQLTVDVVARLAFGVSLIRLALFLLVGLTVWEGAAASVVPAWAAPVGLVLLASVLLWGLVIAACAAARRLRA